MNSDEEEDGEEYYGVVDGKEKGDVYAMNVKGGSRGHGLGEREKRARLAPVKEADEREMTANNNYNNNGRAGGEVLFDAEKGDERV